MPFEAIESNKIGAETIYNKYGTIEDAFEITGDNQIMLTDKAFGQDFEGDLEFQVFADGTVPVNVLQEIESLVSLGMEVKIGLPASPAQGFENIRVILKR